MEAHQPCKDCGSSDALLINDDGSTKCFSCGKFTPAASESDNETIVEDIDFIKGKAKAIPDRCLNYDVCQRYRYNTTTYKDRPVQVATYRDIKGNPVFQKVRYTDKKGFFIVGKYQPLLWGMHLFRGNTKRIIITEGEIDTLSVAQVIGNYPVVSLPSGAGSGKAAIKANLNWLEQFEEVILCFDNDEAGQKAIEECSSLFSIGKCKIMQLPLKDPNEMLQQNKADELYKATWNAQEYRPDGIIWGEELKKSLDNKMEEGLSYPFDTLTIWTYGIRTSEMIVFGAGTGMGKTTFFKEIEAHLLLHHKKNVGVIHLEEQPRETILGLMNKVNNKLYHLPQKYGGYTDKEYQEARDTIINSGLYVYEAFGTTNLQTIKNQIRYMVQAKNCRYIFLDHITALGDGIDDGNNVNQYMRKVVSELANLTRELDFTLFTISHLRKGDSKKTHEEGGRVHLDDLYGAAAIKQWASYVFGLERNQQDEDTDKRHITTLRCLKDRYTGLATGNTVQIKYSEDTGRLSEIIDEPENVPF